jgi:hypothetical protein
VKHDDFNSLQLDDVLTKVLSYVRERTKSTAVHWISRQGLQRVRESSETDWQWTFAAVDVIGHHMWSQPAADTFALFQLW